MAKLGREVGAAGFCFRSFGVRVGVRVNTPELLDKIHQHLPPGWCPQRSPEVDRLYFFRAAVPDQRRGIKRLHLLFGNLEMLARTGDLDEFVNAFESDANTYIAQAAGNRFFVHAGVVGWKGRAIVIPGRSFSGKTILVSEFLKHGATYYSDEFAVFDRHGCVYPFPGPLGIRDGTTHRQLRVPVHEFARKVGTHSLPVGFLLLTHYRQSAQWRPTACSPGKGMLSLLANSLSARQRPAETLRSLQKVVGGVTILEGARGEAASVVKSFLRRHKSGSLRV